MEGETNLQACYLIRHSFLTPRRTLLDCSQVLLQLLEVTPRHLQIGFDCIGPAETPIQTRDLLSSSSQVCSQLPVEFCKKDQHHDMFAESK